MLKAHEQADDDADVMRLDSYCLKQKDYPPDRARLGLLPGILHFLAEALLFGILLGCVEGL